MDFHVYTMIFVQDFGCNISLTQRDQNKIYISDLTELAETVMTISLKCPVTLEKHELESYVMARGNSVTLLTIWQNNTVVYIFKMPFCWCTKLAYMYSEWYPLSTPLLGIRSTWEITFFTSYTLFQYLTKWFCIFKRETASVYKRICLLLLLEMAQKHERLSSGLKSLCLKDCL